jgi:maltodextrin utilization protein YvdJ
MKISMMPSRRSRETKRRRNRQKVRYHTIPYDTIRYHTIPYDTIRYHTISNYRDIIQLTSTDAPIFSILYSTVQHIALHYITSIIIIMVDTLMISILKRNAMSVIASDSAANKLATCTLNL